MTIQNRWKDYLIVLVAAVLLALIVRSLLLTAYKVPTGSMQPALKPGDFIFVLRPAYGFKVPFSNIQWGARIPLRGDLVVFSYPNQPQINYVKRIIGVPGDRVELRKGRLFLNEQSVAYDKLENSKDNPNPQLFDVYLEKTDESPHSVIFQKEGSAQDFGPLVVPPGEIFLLGDNRDASDDSRYWGTVPISQVEGQVLFIWLSLDWQNKWGGNVYPRLRWKRLFSGVH